MVSRVLLGECSQYAAVSLFLKQYNSEADVDSDSFLDCAELSALEEQGRYIKYVSMVESSILAWHGRNNEEHNELKRKLWRQLIITCNCLATRLIVRRKYSKAMGESGGLHLLFGASIYKICTSNSALCS